MFRKFLLTLAGVFAAMLSYAYSPAIRQIKLDVELLEDGSARVELAFNEEKGSPEEPVAAGLYEMMLQASGVDKVLQEKEFSR